MLTVLVGFVLLYRHYKILTCGYTFYWYCMNGNVLFEFIVVTAIAFNKIQLLFYYITLYVSFNANTIKVHKLTTFLEFTK